MAHEVRRRVTPNIAETERSAYEFVGHLDDFELLQRPRPHVLTPHYHFPTESLIERHREIVGQEPVWLREFKELGQEMFLDRDIWWAQRNNLPTIRISPSTFEKTLYFLYSTYALSSIETPYVYPTEKTTDPKYRQIKGELMHESDALMGAIIQGVTNPDFVDQSLRYRYGKTRDLKAHMNAVFNGTTELTLPPTNGSLAPKEIIERTRMLLYEMWKRFYSVWVPMTFPEEAWDQRVPEEYIQQMFQDANMLAIAWARAYVSAHHDEHMLYADPTDRSPLYKLRTRRALRAQVRINQYPYFDHAYLTGEFDGLTIYSKKGEYAIEADEFKSTLFDIPQTGIEHDILMRQLMQYGLMAQGILDPMCDFVLGNTKKRPVDEQSGVYLGTFDEETTDRKCFVVLRMLDRKNATFVTHRLNVNKNRNEMKLWLRWFVAAYEAYYPEIQALVS